MVIRERIRERVEGQLDAEHVRAREAEGWRLVAVEWEREAVTPPAPAPGLAGDVPYGLRVASDCRSLEENPDERRVLVRMLELIVQDMGIPRVAETLTREGYTTRAGGRWTPVEVFEMLPRLVEVGPQIFPTEDWARRRQILFRFVGD